MAFLVTLAACGTGDPAAPAFSPEVDDAAPSNAGSDDASDGGAAPAPTSDAAGSPAPDAPTGADDAAAEAEAAAPPPPQCSPAGVRLSADVQPIFDASCTVCHGATRTDGLDLRAGQSYASLVGVGAVQCGGSVLLVSAGHPAASYLLDVLQGQNLCGGLPMPYGSAPLATSDIATIAAWICEGAPND